jgi:hypothetical protein
MIVILAIIIIIAIVISANGSVTGVSSASQG